MNALVYRSRNEIMFGSRGQQSPDGITVGPRKEPERKLGRTLLGAAIGYTIPAALQAAKDISEKREVRPVDFKTMIGAGLGAAIARNT